MSGRGELTDIFSPSGNGPKLAGLFATGTAPAALRGVLQSLSPQGPGNLPPHPPQQNQREQQAALGGAETAVASRRRSQPVSISVLVVGATVFLIVLAWLDTLRALYNEVFPPAGPPKPGPPYQDTVLHFVFALFATALGVVVIAVAWKLWEAGY